MASALTELVVVATALVLTGCGRSSAPSESAAGAANVAPRPEAAAAATAATADAPQPAITSAEVCKLLAAEEVQAILGANPNPTPQANTPAGDVSQSRCVWDAGSSRGDLSLSVLQAFGGTNSMILSSMPMEGNAVSGLGDQAGVTVQGNYNVEVMVRIGPRVMTLEAAAVGVADKKDAVVAAARSAAVKLR
jgi:hypothetical protein